MLNSDAKMSDLSVKYIHPELVAALKPLSSVYAWDLETQDLERIEDVLKKLKNEPYYYGYNPNFNHLEENNCTQIKVPKSFFEYYVDSIYILDPGRRLFSLIMDYKAYDLDYLKGYEPGSFAVRVIIDCLDYQVSWNITEKFINACENKVFIAIHAILNDLRSYVMSIQHFEDPINKSSPMPPKLLRDQINQLCKYLMKQPPQFNVPINQRTKISEKMAEIIDKCLELSVVCGIYEIVTSLFMHNFDISAAFTTAIQNSKIKNLSIIINKIKDTESAHPYQAFIDAYDNEVKNTELEGVWCLVSKIALRESRSFFNEGEFQDIILKFIMRVNGKVSQTADPYQELITISCDNDYDNEIKKLLIMTNNLKNGELRYSYRDLEQEIDIDQEQEMVIVD